jgi:inner membrane protein
LPEFGGTLQAMKTTILKIGVVALLAAALFVPVNMIQGLVAERQARRNEAVAGIAEGWGKAQVVGGPYLALPYERRWTEVKQELVDGKLRESRTERKEANVARLPLASVDWNVDAALSEKARGIYKARLYNATLKANGAFTLPARGSLEDGASQYRWYVPRLVIGVADPNGIRTAGAARIDSREASFSPGSGDFYAGGSPMGGLHLPMPELAPGEQPKKLSFAFTLELAGSESFAIAPYGVDTAVAMKADWPHPSFQGRYLPARHDIDGTGFSAAWKVSRLSSQGVGGCPFPCLNDQIVVSFVEPASLYQKLERASKYGFLFIGLTFAAFVLLELLRRLAIHPVQYALVGFALAIFFLLLTALSEHIAFSYAYGVATAACVSLITFYLVRVLRSVLAGLAFGGALSALYGFLYALLRAEDYSLLGGTLLLFGLLAALMLATRRVDWYALTTRTAA